MTRQERIVRIEQLLASCGFDAFTSVVEGRDFDGGSSFLETTSDGVRGPDLYLYEEQVPARADIFDLFAELMALYEEVARSSD